MKLDYADSPLVPPAAPDGARAVHIGPLAADDGGMLAGRFLGAMTMLGRALAAEKAGPPHLVALTIRTGDAQALLDADRWELELLYREALGGNFCQIAVVSDPDFDLAVEAHAIVPVPPAGPIHADMDAATLNYEYSARAQVPGHMAHFHAWRTEGAAYRAAHLTAELPYGEGPGQAIDLYMPEGGEGAPPLHIFIHGGYWQALDKSDHGHLLAAMGAAGHAVAVINYDLLPKPGLTIDDLAEQCRRAVEALWRAAPLYGYDRARITISGHSAGGHLGAELAATDWPARDTDMPADLVKGAILVSGLYDLEPLRLTGVNKAVGMDEATAVRRSPIHMKPAHPLPVVVAVGGAESSEFHRQSRAFAEVWAHRGARTEFLALDGLNHFTVLEAFGDPSSALGARALRLMATL
ncbi:alpha/beta hydrolase [Marivibrio halodurans]|uniref:Alpha/beta hydrolase n=1 Tax=Marivibrio halodurans TaxID=2039722 RepID=A0A8J7S4B8_9PROT|nr:alpha/beta hydrolase [Marivibrio halodurans]MBP5855412.1 alpha/beta hydrolase [Marivibrio halodurans]